MSELLTELSTEVERFLGNERTDIQRQLSRTAIVHMYDFPIEIEQSKNLSLEDTRLVRASGPAALVTREWFEDVE